MVKPEIKSQESSKEKDEDIKPLRMKQVTNIRGKLKKFFTKIGIITGIGIVGGVAGGVTARDGFRDITKFDPEWREKLENGEINEEQETEDTGAQTPEEAEEEVGGILSRVSDVLGKAKNATKEAVKKAIDAAMEKIMEKYKNAEKEMMEKYYSAMEEVDNLVFWGGFWTSFAVTIIFALCAIKLKKMVLGEDNPELVALEKQLHRMKNKVNEMIERQNTMIERQFVSPEDQLAIMEQAKKLIAEFESSKDGIAKIND